jgi:DNA polymerase-3 subunit delta
MKIRPEQLARQLEKGLQKAWLVAGDEPFQQGEAVQLIRDAARAGGFDDRKVFSIDTGIDWDAVRNEASSMGLFGGRTLIEIRLGEKRPDKNASAVICEMLEQPGDDVMLLVSCSRLDRRRDIKSKWVSAIDASGALVEVWPVDNRQLAGWIGQRLAAKNLRASADALSLLAERSEGNLLACAQEIDKLALLCSDGDVQVTHIQQAVGDSSRHSVFDLTDALAEGPARAIRVLDGLRTEGSEPPVVLWALTREARILAALASGDRQGLRLPPRKMAQAEQLAGRLGHASLDRALVLAASIDRAIKGMHPGNPWDGLSALVLRLSGQPLPHGLETF